MTKLSAKQIKVSILFVLLLIIGGQVLWVTNMYRTYESQFRHALKGSFNDAIWWELGYRYEKMGGTIASRPRAPITDTTRYVEKKITAIDTVFTVTYDLHDPLSEKKLHQFLLKPLLTVNLPLLDSVFRQTLHSQGYPVQATRIKYYDLTTDTLLADYGDDITKLAQIISTDRITIDITKSIALQAYAQTPTLTILQKMMIQLLLSALLIAICILILYTVIKTFSWRQKMEQMRQDAVNSMTHEFKRPISSALAQVSLIPHYLEKDNTQRAHQYADNTVLELQKLTSYIERVQKLSNDQLGNIALNRTNIELTTFFSTVLEKYENVQEKPTSIDLRLSSMRQHIQADLIHFSNIVDNLIENAIKYSADKVKIHITVSDEDQKLKVSVKDNGIGISDNDLPFIFGKFYRSENKDVQRKVGFGLGLTYVKALVEAHEGQIKVNSTVGKGSEFIVYLP